VVAAVLAYLLVAQFVFSADQGERERERGERMRVDQELAISHEIQTSLLPVGRRSAPPARAGVDRSTSRLATRGTDNAPGLPSGKAVGARSYREPRAASRELPSGDFLEEYGSFVVVGRSEPAREVGGDFYDVFSLADDRLALMLGDVSGKGVPGALFMAVTTTLLQAYARLLHTPDEVLARANENLYPKMRGALGARRRHAAMFVTAFYGILETGTGRLRYASAGQIPPVLSGPGREARYLPGRGVPLGALRAAEYQCHEVCLSPGDLLVLASDGFVEATTRVGRLPGEALGYDRFLKLVARHAHLEPTACAAAIFDDLHRQLTADRERDDLTLVVVRHRSGIAAKET
jgi:serine phosphatase RsbU (regulator of sigma subunit)